MKRILEVATCLSALSLFVGVTAAQDVKVQAPGVRIDAKLDGAKNPGRVMRSSKLIGAEVKNSEKASLGKVDDLVIDEAGRVHYIIMTHGGVLGVGQKYCAVPLRAVAIRDTDSADTHWVELNISPKTLEKAPTFTSDKWPSFTDGSFTKETDVFFNEAPKVKVVTP